MSLTLYFIKSWILGVAIAAPIGPISMICIKKTLELGFVGAVAVGLGAVAVGLGAALADTIYLIIAAAGLTTISHFLVEQAVFFKIFGAMLLIYLAYQETKVGQATDQNPQITSHVGLCKLTSKVFFLTLSNPMTIVLFIGILASIGSTQIHGTEWVAIAAGMLIGGMSWWVLLGAVIVKIKHKIPQVWINRIRYISAMLLVGFAIFALWSGIS